MDKKAIKAITDKGRVTTEIRNEFFSGCSFKEIRDWLEKNGLDRHTVIDLESVEIALLTPLGVLMQIRRSDKDQLGLWGGVLEDGETPVKAAIRELHEETGLELDESQFEYCGENPHFHEYANGDKAYFKSYQFIVRLSYVPQITTNEESVGAFTVVHTILAHQQDFVKRVLGEK